MSVRRSKRSSLPVNKVLLGDSLKRLKELPDKSVDLVFADPPYNLQLDRELLRPNNTIVDGVDDDWDKFGSFADYDRFSRQWLAECQRVLKPDGAIAMAGQHPFPGELGRSRAAKSAISARSPPSDRPGLEDSNLHAMIACQNEGRIEPGITGTDDGDIKMLRSRKLLGHETQWRRRGFPP